MFSLSLHITQNSVGFFFAALVGLQLLFISRGSGLWLYINLMRFLPSILLRALREAEAHDGFAIPSWVFFFL